MTDYEKRLKQLNHEAVEKALNEGLTMQFILDYDLCLELMLPKTEMRIIYK